MTQEDASVEVVADPWHPQNRAREFGDALTENEVREIAAEAECVIERDLRPSSRESDEVAQIALLVLLAGGHLLIEDIPGVGKTMLAKSLAAALGAERHRIQFTPDLLPGDVTGASIFNQSDQRVRVPPRRRVHPDPAGRRDQPRLPEDPVGAPGGHGGAAGQRRRHHLRARGAVHGGGHREPRRDGGHLPPTRGAARPVPRPDLHGLPGARRPSHGCSPRRPGPCAEAITTCSIPCAERTTPERIADHVRGCATSTPRPTILDYVVRLAEATRIPPAGHPRRLAPCRRAPGARREGACRAGRPHLCGPRRTSRTVIMPVWRHRMHLTPQALSRGGSAGELVDQVLKGTSLT